MKAVHDKISLAIVMEYCSGGSISDIYRARKLTLTEEACATIIRETLFGLDYLHQQRKIHRDVKCGNILLTDKGVAKLADFGVSGQLTETFNKRNTVIGTPVRLLKLHHNRIKCLIKRSRSIGWRRKLYKKSDTTA